MFCAQMRPIYQVSVYRTIGPLFKYRTTIAMFNIFVHELITTQQTLPVPLPLPLTLPVSLPLPLLGLGDRVRVGVRVGLGIG